MTAASPDGRGAQLQAASSDRPGTDAAAPHGGSQPRSPAPGFPDADYVVLSSRLIPGLDGGYALATLTHARLLPKAQLLTVDPGSVGDHAVHRAEFAARGLVDDPACMRNLFDEAIADPSWLRRAAHAGAPDPELEYRTVTDAASHPVVAIPVIPGNPDWHLSEAPVAVFGDGGEVVGVVDGFGGLYRAWLEHVVAGLRAASGNPHRVVVVICESRQLGELLAGWADPHVRLVHPIHTIHLEPPFTPDAPLNPLWTRWFDVASRFDAVLWPTASQKADVEERFGPSDVHRVLPHSVDVPARIDVSRTPGLVVMLNRLAPGKRIDHAIRAFAGLRESRARLDIYGEGPEQGRLQELIDELGLGDSVALRGATANGAGVLARASVLLSTSAFEGQGLAIAEALASGCPVVSYDVRYGPRDLLASGGGMLVPDGDEPALHAALAAVLGDSALRERLAAEAPRVAGVVDPAHVSGAFAAILRDVVAGPSRRAR